MDKLLTSLLFAGFGMLYIWAVAIIHIAALLAEYHR